MADFKAKKNTSNVHKQGTAAKANSKGSGTGSFNAGKNTGSVFKPSTEQMNKSGKGIKRQMAHDNLHRFDGLFIVNPAVISAQPVGAEYDVNAEATALNVVADAEVGSLSYKWYSNDTETTTGATEIAGGTSSTYTPVTTSAGTTYYFAEVTATSTQNGVTKTAKITTDIVAVVVSE